MTARYYAIADSRYFVGAVALLNSLRLTGNDEELVLLDRGLTPLQRELLVEHLTLVELPAEIRASSYALKPYPAVLDVDGVVAIIDCDMIVTSSLRPFLERAAEGKICLFPNHPSALDRRFEEWHEFFDLAAPMREQTYLNAGFVAVSVDCWPDFFRRWWAACQRLPENPPPPGDHSEPLALLDQDALNAILMSEIPADGIDELGMYEWVLGSVRVENERTLDCRTRDGQRTPLLHTPRNPKVWQPGGWRNVDWITTAYVRLLPRVLFSEDVRVRLHPKDVPLWLRPGPGDRAAARVVSAWNRTPWVLRRARRIPHRTIRELRGLLGRASP